MEIAVLVAMKQALALFLLIPLVACLVGHSGGADTGHGDEHGTGSGAGGGGTGGGVRIATNTTWTGSVQVETTTTIDPGVTLSVAPGAVVTFKAGASLTVAGTLDAQGISASKIAFTPAGAQSFGPITVPSGGKLTFRYVTMTGAAIRTQGTGIANIVDSDLSNVIGDLLIMNGGNLTVDYSNIGIEGGADTTHCNMHFESTDPNTIRVTHSNIRGVDYGVMFYSGSGANFTYNNWNNDINVAVEAGAATGDFQNSYFKGNPPPAVAGITVTTPALTAALPACNGANDTTCTGPRP